jgi:RNA polymerase sigma-70 factor (ECF subfamily)
MPLRSSLRRFAPSVDTEAVMQETLLRVWQAAPRCEVDGRPNSLLRFAIRIARNLALSEIRRQGGPSADPSDPDPDEIPDPNLTLPDPLLRRRIRDCLGRLPAKPAQAIRARLDGAGLHPDKRLAEKLGMTLNTFLQNVTRARRLLAQCLQGFGITVP